MPPLRWNRLTGCGLADDAPRLSVVFGALHGYRVCRGLSGGAACNVDNVPAVLRLLLVPFGEIQQRVVLSVPPPLRVVIYRRFMMRIAEALANANRAQALVTGEVVGQVASQTVENLTSINEVVTMPVLRPLIGMDKDEITAEAQRLGTYPVSIIPDQDCCTLFTPRHPVTRARRGDVMAAEAGLDVEEIVKQAVAAAVVEEFDFP